MDLKTTLIIFLLLSFSYATDITNCTDITSGGSYVLINNISATRGNCIQINTSNVDLSCGGYTISDGGSTIAIWADYLFGAQTNITIRDCSITGFTGASDYGISYVNPTGDTTCSILIYNNTIWGVGGGIKLGERAGGCNYAILVFNNTINATGVYSTSNPITISGGAGAVKAIIENNTLYRPTGTQSDGIYISSAMATIRNNIGGANGKLNGISITVAASSGTNIYNNKIDSAESSFAGTTYLNTTETVETNIIGGANIGGNYYENYAWYDNDSDGIGDYNYYYGGSFSGKIDYLPLTNNLGTNTPPTLAWLTLPANNSIIQNFPQTYKFSSSMPMQACQIEIAGVNKTGTLSGSNYNCTYTSVVGDQTYGQNYNITNAYAMVNNTVFTLSGGATNVSWYSCSNIASNTTLLYNISTTSNCFGINDNNLLLDCNGMKIEGTTSVIAITPLVSKQNATIKNCIIKNVSYGIYCAQADCKLVENNTLSYCVSGCIYYYIDGAGVAGLTIKNNNIPITTTGISIYAQSPSGVPYGTSSNLNIINNSVLNSSYGLYLSGYDQNKVHFNNYTISDNNFTGSSYAVYLYQASMGSRQTHFLNNTFTGNKFYGKFYWYAKNSSLDNRIYNNYFNDTVSILSGDITLFANYFNTSKTLGTNIIGGAYIGGNSWYNYTGVDTDGDGIGETNYTSGKIVDYLPLTNNQNFPPSIIITKIDGEANDSTITDTTPNVEFYALEDVNTTTSCTLYIDEIASGSNAAVANNTLTNITTNWTLTGGSHDFYVNCSDSYSTNKSLIWTEDLLVSEMQLVNITHIDAKANNSYIFDTTPNVEFYYIDSFNTTASCTLWVGTTQGGTDNAVSNNTLTNITTNFTLSDAIAYNFSVNCTDGYSTNVSSGWTMTTDLIQPSIAISSPTATTYSAYNVSLEYIVTDAHLDSCTYSLNLGAAVPLPACANTTFLGISGANSITVFANDTAGNSNTSSVSFNINIPISSLSISSIGGQGNNSNITDRTPDVIFSFIDSDNATASCTIYADGTAGGTNASAQNNTATTITINYTLDYGDHTFVVNCSDGKTESSSASWKEHVYYPIDSVTMLLVDGGGNNSLINDHTPDVTFIAIDNDSALLTCSLLVNGAAGYGSSSSVQNNTNTSITITSTLITGDYNFSVNCTDGIYSLESGMFNESISDPPPITILISPAAGTNLSQSTWTFSWYCNDSVFLTNNATLYIDGVANVTKTCVDMVTCSQSVSNLACGTRNWSVRCTNPDGYNDSEVREFRPYPTFSALSPMNGSYYRNETNATFSATITCVPSSQWFEATDNNLSISYNYSGSLSSFTFTNSSAGLNNTGNWSWSAFVKDSDGTTFESEERMFYVLANNDELAGIGVGALSFGVLSYAYYRKRRG